MFHSSLNTTTQLITCVAFVTSALGGMPVMADSDTLRVTEAAKTAVNLPQISPLINEPDTLEARWENLGRLYKNDKNDTLQELWILGRFHGQYHWAEGSAGKNEAYETRRFRLGGQAKLFDKLNLHAQMVSGSDFEPFYNGFTELWAQWAFKPEATLTVGQQKHRFTHDRNASSRYINYLERSMLTNMFAADYTPAVTLLGKINKLTYSTGVFSNATGTNMADAFTQLDSGYSILAAAYYDLGKPLGWDTAHLYFSYLHSDANENATNLDRFDNGLATALIFTDDALALVTELTAGLGSEAGDAVGLNFQPSYFITESLQLAGRYQIAASNNVQGLSAQRRYERDAGLPSGDLYQAVYLGLNYNIAKHRLKIMSGLEYAAMGGEEVWTASTAIRFFFGPHSGGPYPMIQSNVDHSFQYD